MDKYRKMDLDDRDIWTATCSGKCKIEYTIPQGDRVDGQMTGATGVVSVFELKQRNCFAERWDKEGWYMQEDKWQALIDRMKKNKADQALYITITTDWVYVWRVDNITPTFQNKRMTYSTATNYRENIVEKSVACLKPEDCLWKVQRL